MKIIYVDIDGTVCSDENGQYEFAKPIVKNIKKVNKLFDEGHTVIYWTARGSVTNINWKDLTEKQFKEWGVKYHDLRVGNKPHYDLFICDKSKRIEEL